MPIDLLTLPTTTTISQAKKMTVNNFEVSPIRRVTDCKVLARLAFGDCTENEAYPSQEAKMFKSNLKLLFQVSHLTDSTEQVSVIIASPWP